MAGLAIGIFVVALAALALNWTHTTKIALTEPTMHTGEDALPVVDGTRFFGMPSVAALCHARLDGARHG